MSEWKMVPVEPTDEMVQAALRKFQADTGYVWDTEAAPVWMLDAIKAAFAAAPPGPITTFKVDGAGTVTVTATGVRFESSEKVIAAAPPAPSAERWVFEAPCDLAKTPWTEDEIARLDAVLNENDEPSAEPTAECTTCGAIVLGVAEPSEPVAWMYDCGGGGRMYADSLADPTGWTPLYAHPAPALPAAVEAMRMALDWLESEQLNADEDCGDLGCAECEGVTRPRQRVIDALRAAMGVAK
jgi:hypothetical protein